MESVFPRARITHRAEFCAALRLANPALSEDRNRELYGVCFSPHSHGHNYLLDVTVEGPVPPETGMVMDLMQLQELVRAQIIQQVDHKHLNKDVDFLENRVPTSENLLLCFWDILAASLPAGVSLVELRLQESRDHSVIYRGPHASR